MRILLVDDNCDFLDCVEEFLSPQRDVEVVGRFQSAHDALVRLEELKPDLVLIDPVLRELDGFEAIWRIKAFPQPPLVVVLTLFANEDCRTAAQAAGADALVSKWDSGRPYRWFWAVFGPAGAVWTGTQ